MWTSKNSNYEVFKFLDEVGECVEMIMEEANFNDLDKELLEAIVEEKNTKLEMNKESILSGFYFLSSLNKKLFE